jgi:hypothetical protein
MAHTSRLNTELLNWFFSVSLTTTTAFLVILFPVIESMSRLQKTPDMQIFISRYAGSIGTVLIVLSVNLVLTLLWHTPRMLAANLQRKQHWLDNKLANAIFAAGAISVAVFAKLAGQKSFDYNEQLYSITVLPRVQPTTSFACCIPDEKMIFAVYSIWFLMASFSILYGLYLAWIGWNQRRSYQ